MAEDKIIEGEAKEVEKKPAARTVAKEASKEESPATASKPLGAQATSTSSKPLDPRASAAAIKDAVESMGKAVSSALQDRGNVVMVRVNDETLHSMDVLVAAEIAKSRSEAAALLIAEGIRANAKLYNRIGDITQQISDLKVQLREALKK